MGSVMKSRPMPEKVAMTRRFADRWLAELEAGGLEAMPYRTFPLEDVALAHAAMEAGGHVGKLVLLP